MVNSRQKGARGERDALDNLRAWWGGEPWKRRGLGQKGADITTPPDFPWTVEVKNTAQYLFRHLMFPNQVLKDHIKQTLDQVEGDKKPLLVSKIERNWMVATFEALPKPDCNHIVTKLPGYEITWTTLEEFIKRENERLPNSRKLT